MDNVRKYLLDQKTRIETKLKTLEREESADPMIETRELGGESWYLNVTTTKATIKYELSSLLHAVTHSLQKVHQGTYGLCENCKKKIEDARLKIIPTAQLCAICSRFAGRPDGARLTLQTTF